MPQNAVIGVGGDYASIAAWVTGEQSSNYGAPTRCYITGTTATTAVITLASAGGKWPNGIEIRTSW